MSRIYIRTKLSASQTTSDSLSQLKQEITDLRIKELHIKRVKNNTKFLKRAKRRSKFTKRRKEKREKFDGYHIALEANLPKSEQWFRPLYLNEGIERMHTKHLFVDKFNYHFNRRYMPDVQNRGYRYIIEIDGSWHDQPDVQFEDAKKDYYYQKRGYCVIRIKAYDEPSYKDGMIKLKEHIQYMETVVLKHMNKK